MVGGTTEPANSSVVIMSSGPPSPTPVARSLPGRTGDRGTKSSAESEAEHVSVQAAEGRQRRRNNSSLPTTRVPRMTSGLETRRMSGGLQGGREQIAEGPDRRYAACFCAACYRRRGAKTWWFDPETLTRRGARAASLSR